MNSFTVTFEIDQAIHWDLYKSSLADELLDRTADAPNCPHEISDSAWTGQVEV
jgi:hypothetical protein